MTSKTRGPGTADSRAAAMAKGRQADSARRRQRVIAALDKAAGDGTEISVSAIARIAAVDRTFLYRHRDLLARIHALEATPPPGGESAPGVTRASLQADLLAAHERAVRLSARVRQLEKRLSEVLGEQKVIHNPGRVPSSSANRGSPVPSMIRSGSSSRHHKVNVMVTRTCVLADVIEAIRGSFRTARTFCRVLPSNTASSYATSAPAMVSALQDTPERRPASP
jgi:hypothetical protein